MEALERLLRTPHSRLADVLRCGLHGLAALLQEAQRLEGSNAPGAPECNELLGQLHTLLRQPAAGIPGPPAQPAPPPLTLPPPAPASVPPPAFDFLAPSAPSGRAGLQRLRTEILTDSALVFRVGTPTLSTDNDATLWTQVQRLFLRLPTPLAELWQQRALVLAHEAGAREVTDPQACDTIPWFSETVIYPALAGSIRARGLRGSPAAPLPPSLPPLDPESDLHALGVAVAVCLHFVDKDPALHHAYRGIQPYGITPLPNRDQQRRYSNQLLRRFQTVISSEALTPSEALRARLDFDEALHSLIYKPPADAESSWWGLFQQRVRATLEHACERVRAAGGSAVIKPLAGLYADVLELTGGAGTNVEVDGGGPPGHVVTCLRVHARINHDSFPGRVVYCPV